MTLPRRPGASGVGTHAVLAVIVLAAACGGSRSEAAPGEHAPAIALAPLAASDLCLTRGEIAGTTVSTPTLRGHAHAGTGDAAQLTFTYRGDSIETRALAGGDARRQIGLKLRAQDGCNVVYVMWRMDPRPKLDVSVKLNPLARTHEECGADGYTKVRPSRRPPVAPALEPGATHTLRAEIVADELFAWIDGRLLWRGPLPRAARALHGPAGLRSDNVRFDLVELAVPPLPQDDAGRGNRARSARSAAPPSGARTTPACAAVGHGD